MRKFTIIGAGNIGTTLGILACRHGHEVAEICSRTPASATRAREAIGQGKVVDMAALSPADILLVATGDNAIPDVAATLAGTAAVRPGTVVFHCSGATLSDVLAGLRAKGAHVASVHPVKTFTAPQKDSADFAGTWCGTEGDEAALAVLEPLMQSFGAKTFRVDPSSKTLYHAALVFMCNYFFPVLEAGFKCYEAAGVDRATAAQAVKSILHATADNALALGPGKALTGPIARGDDTVVANQLRALGALDPDLKVLYEVLGSHATALALQKGVADPEKIARIRELLSHQKYVTAA